MSFKFIKELKRGDRGDEVKALQEFIIKIHFQNVLINGKQKTVTADGDFGEATETAVEAIKAKALDYISTEYIKQKFNYWYNQDVNPEWLEISGTVNPLFGMLLEHWYEVQEYLGTTMKGMDLTPDEEPDAGKLIETVIRLETKEIGVVEKTGNNDGERVEWYQRRGSCGEVSKGSPYCQYGQNAMLMEGCEEEKVPYKWDCNGYTPYAVNKGKQLKIVKGGNSSGGHVKLEDVKRGDWGYVYSSSRKNACHVFIIIGKKGNNVLTIEFNTNSAGSREGNGCWNRVRSINQVWAILRWADLYD